MHRESDLFNWLALSSGTQPWPFGDGPADWRKDQKL